MPTNSRSPRRKKPFSRKRAIAKRIARRIELRAAGVRNPEAVIKQEGL